MIKAQIAEINRNSNDVWTDSTLFSLLKKEYERNWSILFKLANLGDLKKPLTPKILSDPEHKVTKHILYLYSIESFIYADVNRAIREKDETKI